MARNSRFHTASSVTADLEHWKVETGTTLVNRMLEVEIYSPEWLQIFQDAFKTYDELEISRRERSEPRLSWQTAIEDARKRLQQGYEARDKEIPAQISMLYPLSTHLSHYLKDNVQDRSHQWRSMFENWTLFQLLYGEQDDETTHDFRNSLSYTQHASYGILCEWWQALYCDPELIDSIKVFLNQRLDDTSFAEGFEKIDPEATSINKSLYHASCFKLFYSEFNPHTWNSYLWRVTLLQLADDRVMASTHATLQRFAISFVPQSLDRLSPKLQWRPYTSIITKETGWHGPSEHSQLPKYLWDTVAKQTILVSNLSNSPSYTCISHTWGRWRNEGVSVSVAGVPWQVPTNSLYNVSDLPGKLEALSVRYVWLDLFCIPQDGSTAADVEIGRQASIFGRAHDCIAWLHDVDTWQGTQKAMTWISIRYLQHATLHANSRTARLSRDVQTAWTEANTTQAELVRVSWGKSAAWYQMLQASGSPNPFPGHNELLALSAGTVAEPATWFSSLWTLQEAVLRPNLRLCSQSFEPLTDAVGQPLPLFVLMQVLTMIGDYATHDRLHDVPFSNSALYQQKLWQRSRSADRDTWPGSSRCLLMLDVSTGLAHTLKSRFSTDVLVNAESRQCTGSRAEAIMSAIGASDWYNKRVAVNIRENRTRGLTSLTSRPQYSDSLVLDIYPLVFVQEIAQKVGAAFYNTGSFKSDMRLPLNTAWGGDRAFGSMLPFGRHRGGSGISFGSAPPFPDANVGHESVNGWSISQNGSVIMPEVAILLSTHKSSSEKGCPATIIRPPPNYEDEPELTFDPTILNYATNDFHESLIEISTQELKAFQGVASSASAPRVYAVCLFQSPFHQYGIILLSPQRRKFPRSLGGKRYLIKIGLYQTYPRQMPLSRRVNWVVL